MRRHHDPVVRIGEGQGRIALYLDELYANDLLALFQSAWGSSDGATAELAAAIEEAYPDKGDGRGVY